MFDTNRNVNYWHNELGEKYWRDISWREVLGADPEKEIDSCFQRGVTPSSAKEHQYAVRIIKPLIGKRLRKVEYLGSGVQNSCSGYSFSVCSDRQEEVEEVGRSVAEKLSEVIISYSCKEAHWLKQ
tara:strand:- start:236 stop:613 length:378 start_codon:yes stop_codon:yes gene_type:complete